MWWNFSAIIMASYAVTSALRSILEPNSNIGSELSTALVSLGSAIDQIGTKQETMEKDLELVRRMTRTNWLMVLNLPLPFGVSKGQALQLLFSKLDYTKPLFDSDRDLIASDLLHVNRNGLLCNMSFLVAQRHYDHILSAPFQRKLIDYNKGLNKGNNISIVKFNSKLVKEVQYHASVDSREQVLKVT
ncbi:hypothetical protein ANCCAN_01811 [Ancylostoma caninum]|uniref:Uncharacterized protein n=1 Tax=Ancylostoma caninum TaxID=29170 RepID=A0A368H5Z1_ANCCA|nr:hypothetical protein ANCCAN_01811 [Ancylostoma caninum]